MIEHRAGKSVTRQPRAPRHLQKISDTKAAKMGTSGSGRHRTKNRGAIDAAPRLDMRNLRTRGFLRPGASCSGPVSWTRRGQESGSISLTVDLSDINAAFAQLNFKLDGVAKSQRLVIEATPSRLDRLAPNRVVDVRVGVGVTPTTREIVTPIVMLR